MTKHDLTGRLRLVALALLLLSGCGRSRDNVVIVVIDTLRQDHLATYGYARDPAPFLGQLARDGAVFDGLSTSSWTKPAVASLLSGLHPVRHQVFDSRDRLPPETPLLAEQLRAQGYHTLAASANGWISPLFGFDRGFQRFLMHKEFDAKGLNRRLLPLLDELTPPFFLYVHYLDPHAPYDAEIGWDGRPLSAPLRAAGPVRVEDLDRAHVRQRPVELLSRAIDLYDGEIRETDDALRELVEALTRRGLMESTVLVVTSDHGEEFEDHGRMAHGQTLYQEVLAVPLVMRAPHRFRGGQRLGRASLLDVVPTLAAWLPTSDDRNAPARDGVDLAPLLTGKRKPAADHGRAFLAHVDFEEGAALALLDGDDKLILERSGNALFDLRQDPRERHDLIQAPDAISLLARLGTELVELYNTYAKERLERVAVEGDGGLQQSMVALGYVSFNQEARRRVTPHRLESPVFGWLRWAPFASGANCAPLDQPEAGTYLFQGWYGPEQGGRWSERRASVGLFPIPGDPRRRLLLVGVNHRPGPVRLRVDVEGQSVLRSEVVPGPFQLSVEIPEGVLKPRSILVLEADTAFVPSKYGSSDPRALGLFWTTICLNR